MTGPFKSKKKGQRCKPINSAHTITRPNSSTDDTHITAVSDYARIARGAIRELFFLPIPITLRDSNTSAMGDVNTATAILLSRWLPSQHPQLDPLPEEPQPPPEADRKRNPARTRRRPLCGTDFDRHGH
ncbi:hypothetical protein PVK06_007885 [Gossypium arboreum]|uniref:Uncharacterized protein n=1 Tax=Gossypium arboreum TaxID=29729 RepID=A0ABR0QJX2_GOSAR|nr:hypothetical protein PVK06_007885 [Gossypium arboreum]